MRDIVNKRLQSTAAERPYRTGMRRGGEGVCVCEGGRAPCRKLIIAPVVIVSLRKKFMECIPNLSGCSLPSFPYCKVWSGVVNILNCDKTMMVRDNMEKLLCSKGMIYARFINEL